MIGLTLTIALLLNATPAERQAAFLQKHLDGSSATMNAMHAEFEALDLHWSP